MLAESGCLWSDLSPAVASLDWPVT